MAITVYTYNDKVLKNIVTDKWLKKPSLPPIAANTVRVRTSDGNAPVKYYSWAYDTATLVTGTTDIYDVYKSGTSLSVMFNSCTNIVEVLGANTTGITNMSSMFTLCDSLTSVSLFDTSSVTDMSNMFQDCTSLTSVPLFDTSNVTNMGYTFSGCRNVQSGALALYQQASTQTTPPSSHNGCFSNCGSNTTTGAAELAQIPTSWGGTAS